MTIEDLLELQERLPDELYGQPPSAAVSPLQWRDILIAAWRQGEVTVHEAVRQLFNLGLRGPYLNLLWKGR